MLFPDYETLSMAELKSKISKLTNIGAPERAFLHSNITDWQQSERRTMMLEAQDYYKNKTKILERKRYYIDRKGNKQESTSLSNTQLPHPYMRRLVNQKVNYLLSKPFTVTCEDENFVKLLDSYFDKDFRRKLKNVGKDAIVNGIAWLQVYYDEVGNLSFKRIPSEEVIPFWRDIDHTELDAVLRLYPVTHLLPTGAKKVEHKVEYHTTNGVWYYVMDEHGLHPDKERGDGLNGHFFTMQEADTNTPGNEEMSKVDLTWNRVPFIAFKYNTDELSLLSMIKHLIDDYDINTSDTSNNLQDVPNSIKVVRNYDGTDPGEFVQNLATFRTAFVAGDGDMTALHTPLDITAVDGHLNRLKRDIFEAGSGVDTQDEHLGNASGVALKFRYAGLDMDTADMANEFAAALENLIWFIQADVSAKNKVTGEPEVKEVLDFDISFNTDIIIHETETIQNVKSSVGILSDETILANHPWVEDVINEQKRVEEQRKKELDQQKEMIDFENGFGQE